MDILNQFSSAPIPTLSSFPVKFPSAVDPLHGLHQRPAASKPLDSSQPVAKMKSTPAAAGNVTMPTFMPSTFTQPVRTAIVSERQPLLDKIKIYLNT